MWFRVPYVVLEMFHAVSRGQHVLALFQLVSCGQRDTPDVSYGTWCRVASVVYSFFVVWFRGQCVKRDVSCGFVWPVWYSRCFMWFRVASLKFEMFQVVSVARVVLELFHVVSCGQRGNRDVSCGFVWPVVVEMFHVASVDVVSCGQRRTRDASCGFV